MAVFSCQSGDSGAQAGGGSGEECEGEEQEDPSSSFVLAEESLIQMTISEPEGENKVSRISFPHYIFSFF